MATGALSSLGLGSDGVLSYDVIEQLKEADVSTIIKPIKTNLTNNAQKSSDLSLLKSLVTLFQADVSDLSDEITYLKRDSVVSGDSVSVVASSGSNIEEFDIDVTQVAKRNVFESNGFSSQNDTFATKDETINFYVGSKRYSVDVTPSTTIKNFVSLVYEATDGKVEGTILNTGGENPYKLTLKSKDSGIENRITFGTQSVGDNVAAGSIDISAVGAFSINGVDITMNATDATNSSSENANALKVAIETAIENNSSLEGFSVDLDSTGRRLIVTDSRGGKVEFGGTELANLGLASKSSYPSTTSNSISAGEIDIAAGEFTINGVDITLNTDDTAENNADALRAAIQAKIDDGSLSELSVSVSGDKVTINNIDGTEIVFGGSKANLVGFNGKDVTNGAIKALGLSQIQSGEDAKFTYNGIDITRSSNKVDDLRVGLTINIVETGKSSVSITQDKSTISKKLATLVSSYNTMISKLNDLTKYDLETGESGIFQGTSEIVSAKSYINRIILKADENGSSLADYGVILEESGNLSFDESVFDNAFSSDPKAMEDFFRGSVEYSDVTYSSSPMSSNAFSTTDTELQINGVSIVFTAPGTSVLDNVKALQDAINDANITGLSVRINSSDDGLIFTAKDGENIEISTSLSGASKTTLFNNLGLETIAIKSKSTTNVGLFSELDSYLDRLIDGETSVFGTLNTMFTNEKENLTKEMARSQERIDIRYQMMATQFASYDSMIAQLNQSFSSLNMMIQAEINAK